jgi:hypothetical protein
MQVRKKKEVCPVRCTPGPQRRYKERAKKTKHKITKSAEHETRGKGVSILCTQTDSDSEETKKRSHQNRENETRSASQPSLNTLGPTVLDRVPIACPRPITDPEQLVPVRLNALVLEDRVGVLLETGVIANR